MTLFEFCFYVQMGGFPCMLRFTVDKIEYEERSVQ